MVKKSKIGGKWSIKAVFSHLKKNFPTDFFSKMHGKVPMGSEKPTDIVTMLRHFFRVTTVKEGCVSPAVRIQDGAIIVPPQVCHPFRERETWRKPGK